MLALWQNFAGFDNIGFGPAALRSVGLGNIGFDIAAVDKRAVELGLDKFGLGKL